jgi:hypothetical protein
LGKPKEEEIEVEELEEFDPSYEMKGIVEEMLKTGLRAWSAEKLFRAKIKGSSSIFKIKISASVEEVT